MKFLFIVKVMLRDWMSVHRRYTFIILITMILSVQALFFIANKNAGNNIEDVFMEKYTQVTYGITPSMSGITDEDEIDKFYQKHPEGGFKADRTFLEKYVSSDVPLPYYQLDHCAELSGLVTIQLYAVNGIPMYEIKGVLEPFMYFTGVPVFESKDKKFEAVFNMSHFDHTIIDGRDYTEKELEDHAHVLVVSDQSGFKTGDILDCGKYDFEVIGVFSSNWGGDFNMIPYWYAEECMNEYHGSRPINYADDYSTDLGGYDCYAILDRLTLEKPFTSSQKKEFCKISGLKEHEITTPYQDFFEEEYTAYYRTTIIESAVFGLFCAANIILAIWSLCQKHIDALRTFRVYGASAKTEILLIVTLIMCMTMAAVVVGGVLCLPMQKLYENINPIYAWRPYCMVTALAALVIINLLTAIPTAVLTVRRSPVGK